MEYIRIEDLKLDIDGKPILKDVEFSLNKGKIAVLLGPNGSG